MIAALALGLALAAVDVAGDVSCPTAGEVSRMLADMAPAMDGATGAPPVQHRARLSRTEAGLHLELLTSGDERIAERDLDGGESCADLARAIAVIIVAWEADLDPRLSARVDLPAPASRTMPPDAAIQTTTALATPAPPLSFDVGLALIASLTGGQLAPGASIQGWIAPGGWHTGVVLTVSGVTSRSEAVGDRADAARWSRFAAGAGPEVRFSVAHTTVATRAQFVAALLSVEGVGLTTTTSGSTAQFGTSLGIHVGRPWGNAFPWIGADLLFWPGHDRLEITGLAAEGQLPRFELQVAIGLSLGRFL